MIGTRLKDAPKDLAGCAKALGIGDARMARLKEKHGDKLLLLLQRRWRDNRDHPNLLPRNSVYEHTDVPFLAMSEEPEAVSDEEISRLHADSRLRFLEEREAERAHQSTRSRVARLRQVEALAQKKGVDALPFILRIESEIRALEDQLNRPNPEAA